MRKIFSYIILATAAFSFFSCSSWSNEAENDDTDSLTNVITDEDLEYLELNKVSLPCTKEVLSAAWKRINASDAPRGESLKYKQHLPTLFISTDLDKDGHPEVLLRGEPPYAAIYTFVQDSLRLITYVDYAEMDLAVTQNGVILRSGTNRDGSYFSQFIKLKDSRVSAVGESRETFKIKNNEMVSTGTQYFLRADSALIKVTQEQYQQVAPTEDAVYLENIEGWEDFRKP